MLRPPPDDPELLPEPLPDDPEPLPDDARRSGTAARRSGTAARRSGTAARVRDADVINVSSELSGTVRAVVTDPDLVHRLSGQFGADRGANLRPGVDRDIAAVPGAGMDAESILINRAAIPKGRPVGAVEVDRDVPPVVLLGKNPVVENRGARDGEVDAEDLEVDVVRRCAGCRAGVHQCRASCVGLLSGSSRTFRVYARRVAGYVRRPVDGGIPRGLGISALKARREGTRDGLVRLGDRLARRRGCVAGAARRGGDGNCGEERYARSNAGYQTYFSQDILPGAGVSASMPFVDRALTVWALLGSYAPCTARAANQSERVQTD